MSLLSPLSPEQKKASPREVRNAVSEFPFLEEIQKATREKIKNVFTGTWDRISQWLRNKIDQHLPGFLDTPKSYDLPQTSMPETEEDVRQREIVLKDFAVQLNEYRKRSGSKELKTDNELMSLAEKVAAFQVSKGALTHTSDDYRRHHTIHGEILVSGFSSAEEALKKFIDSQEHYQQLMGTHIQMGYAIRPGIEISSGQTMYYLVVLFRGGKALDPKRQKSKIAAPELPELKATSLEDALNFRPSLKPYFSLLDDQVKNHSGLKYTFDLKKSFGMTQDEKRAGLFYISVENNGTSVLYMVSSSPARLSRKNKGGKIVQIRFEEMAEDVAKAFSETVAKKAAPLKASKNAQEVEEANDS